MNVLYTIYFFVLVVGMMIFGIGILIGRYLL